jgi:ABC-type nitrate/sulfonate/bicarbonate transport system permease component
MNPTIRKTFVVLRSFAAFIFLWWLLFRWNNNPLQLPSPFQVFESLSDLFASGEILQHAWISTHRMLRALTLSIIFAIPIGFLMGTSNLVNQLIDPLIEILRPISGIAWLPLALFIFGVGDTLPVFIMFYVGFFPILYNTIAGIQQTDKKLIAASKTMGVSTTAVIIHVLIPSALPTIMVGVRLAFAGSWAAIVAAELIGSPSGLGFAIEWYRQLLMTPKVLAFIVTIGIVGFVCDAALRILQKRLSPWVINLGDAQ